MEAKKMLEFYKSELNQMECIELRKQINDIPSDAHNCIVECSRRAFEKLNQNSRYLRYKEYYETKKKEIKQKQAEYRRLNAEKIKEQRKQYYQNNRDKILQAKRAIYRVKMDENV